MASEYFTDDSLEMMARDAVEVCGPRHSRTESRRGSRWGPTQGKIPLHDGKTEIEVRDFCGIMAQTPQGRLRHNTGFLSFGVQL